ncbi:MAG: hypothetical protein ACRC46_00025 [Thermoguttaceae bacterium]
MTHSLRLGFLFTIAFVVLSAQTSLADGQSTKRWLGPFAAKKVQNDQIGPDIDRDGFAALETLVGAPLSDDAITRIESVVTRQPIYRHMPTQTVQCNPALIAFCVYNPDVVVALWEKLGVTELSMREIATEENDGVATGRYVLTESTGTSATVDRLYFSQTSRDGICLVGIRGTYRGPFVNKEIDGESLLLFRWQVENATESAATKVVCRLDTFVSIHHAAADALAKMLVPVLGKIADSNFEQTMQFMDGLAEAISSDSETIKQIVYRLPTIRREVRRDFGRILEETTTPAQQAKVESTASFPL